MPTINLHRKTKEKRIYKTKVNNENHKVYNTNIWRKLRFKYLSEHPLCERCLLLDKITPATDVHHKYEIDNGDNIYDKQTIGYDWNNLEALCEQCHTEHHRNKRYNIK